MEKSLTICRASMEQAREILAPALLRGDTTGGACGLGDLCAGGEVFVGLDGGKPAFAYVLGIVNHEAARVAWVKAAAGSVPGVDLTAQVLPFVERQAKDAGAVQVAFTTRRRGLIKKMREQGYTVTGVTMRKAI